MVDLGRDRGVGADDSDPLYNIDRRAAFFSGCRQADAFTNANVDTGSNAFTYANGDAGSNGDGKRCGRVQD